MTYSTFDLFLENILDPTAPWLVRTLDRGAILLLSYLLTGAILKVLF